MSLTSSGEIFTTGLWSAVVSITDFALYSMTSRRSKAFMREVPPTITQSFSMMQTGFLREISSERRSVCMKVEPNGNLRTFLSMM